MNTKNILLAGLFGGIAAFLIGFLFYGLLLPSMMDEPDASIEAVMRSDEDILMIPLFVGHLALGLLLAIIFGRWGQISAIRTGALAGAVIGLLMGIMFDLIMYATSYLMSFQDVLIDLVITTIMTAITGIVVAWWFGRNT